MQTVKSVIHNLEFPNMNSKPKTKKVIRKLYIDADEDHISLQFNNNKGDITTNNYGRKNNTMLVKLIYVYEGIENENFASKRRRLINPYYFCRACSDDDNGKLRDKVYEYICSTYDIDKIEKIYLNGDGWTWIKSFKKRVKGVTYVLDKFHINKYIKNILSYAYDSKNEVEETLVKTIKHGTKQQFCELIEYLRKNTDANKNTNLLDNAEVFLLNNWTAARRRFSKDENIIGCSAEGHVSYVLSSRMSSRPLGWSKVGAA